MATDNVTKLKHLEKLLQFAPATELRRSVQATLFAYLQELDDAGLPENFKEVVENHFFLIDFLDKLES
jgi:hypothetical protein